MPIEQVLAAYTILMIQQLCADYLVLNETGILPENGPYYNLCVNGHPFELNGVTYYQTYDVSTVSFALVPEAFKRFTALELEP